MTQAMKALLELELDLVPPSVEFRSHIADTARKLAISVYDASYIALSDMTATNLITADRKLHEKISEKGRAFLLNDMGRTWSLPKYAGKFPD